MEYAIWYTINVNRLFVTQRLKTTSAYWRENIREITPAILIISHLASQLLYDAIHNGVKYMKRISDENTEA